MLPLHTPLQPERQTTVREPPDLEYRCWATSGETVNPFTGESDTNTCNADGIPPLYLCPKHLRQFRTESEAP